MSRSPSKKGGFVERRKRARGKAGKRGAKARAPETASQRTAAKPVPMTGKDGCAHCGTSLKDSPKALFVEEDVGRIFCSEECIAAYFNPEIAVLEKEYYRLVEDDDIPAERREELAYLRWITLEEPDEVWRQKTSTGDYRYTLISEFSPSNRSVWCICTCLFLKGEPSFLYLAFATIKPGMVAHYRRGEQVPWSKPASENAATETETGSEASGEATTPDGLVDGLAEEWTQEETVRAQIGTKRRDDDIPADEFHLYQTCIEETLKKPDEVWSLNVDSSGEKRLFHFIRHYANESPPVWFIIIAREVENGEQLEVLDAFPTRDPELVERHRQGDQEVGEDAAPAQSKMVH